MLEKKSRFLLELNEMPNRGGRVATDFVRLFNFQCIKTIFSRSSTAQLIYPRFRSNLRTQAGFLEHLSVKPGPKRLNFYGQSAIFDHFVRNRHFSIVPFTDRRPISIDVSVNAEKVWKNKLCPPV